MVEYSMKKPKERIKKVFEKVVGNGGQITKAMREMEYSENTINTPQKVTESKSWEMLEEQYLPDNKVLERHSEALDANKVISARTMGNADEKTDDFIEVPDHQIRLKAVELAYKVKGKLNETKNLTLNKIDIIITDYDEFKNRVGSPKETEGSF